MEQKIEVPSHAEYQAILAQIEHASELALAASGVSLVGNRTDLATIQNVLDSKLLEPEATYLLQALGLAFGRIFIKSQDDYEWCMVDDEYGRDPAIRYKQTSLLLFPLTIISKRFERGENVNVTEMFEKLQETVDDLRAKNYSTE
ncbi:DUF3806 domain-containing protein [Variovorax paradoxus]|uniref:DUF3806 domain-containing protein n=1 Tax=Variovorax paradoxus TaxID=34073 RepID=UPI0021ACDF88|nr:DUF3806 domain-containing protein [Variovorax paradoxus]UVH58937.1 DUF3806 domain-containing protein [Variovorax paradoxus]